MFLVSIVFADYSVKTYLVKSREELDEHLYDICSCNGYEILNFFVNYLGDNQNV